MSKRNEIGQAMVANRRKFVKTMGISASAALCGFTGIGSGVSDEVEIVTHKKGDKPVITKTVPAAWWNHTQEAKKVKSIVRSNYLNKSYVKSTGLSSHDKYYGGKRGFQIKVEVTSNEAKENIPDQQNGIPINTEVSEESTLTASCHGGLNFDTLPGGVVVDEKATTGSQFYVDLDGDGYYTESLLTCLHTFGDKCNSHIGTVVEQYEDEWGKVESQSSSNDIALSQPYSGYDVDNGIFEDDDNFIRVQGYVTEAGILDFDSENKTIYKTGRSTGTVSGYISVSKRGSSGCTDYGEEGIKCDMNQAGGDSGGPIYDRRSGGDEAYMVGYGVAALDFTGNYACNTAKIYANTLGPSAYHIADVFNGQFTAPI